jgi:hypothetical protein
VAGLDAFAAKDAGSPPGAGLLSAMGTVDHFGTNPAVDVAIAGVHLQHFGFQFILSEIGSVAEQFPHRLAGQGKALQLIAQVIDLVPLAIRFGSRPIRFVPRTFDLEVLKYVNPDAHDVKFQGQNYFAK